MTSRFDDLPDQMKHLPVDHRGFPVPWFVHIDDDGIPHFPVIETKKLMRAHRFGLCWVCGGTLGRWRASVIGPMCAITRTISEPQSHVACARFSARRCPFLSQPRMGRVPTTRLPAGARKPAGDGILRNPGVACVWVETQRTRAVRVGDGWLFELGDPVTVEWWCEGRMATRAEVEASIESGLPALVTACWKEAPGVRREQAFVELARRCAANDELLPSEA